MVDQIGRFNYAAYGSLLTVMAGLGSTATLFTDALASGDRATLRACGLIYDTLIAAAMATPEYGVTTDARKQFLSWLINYRDYAVTAASGSGDTRAIAREIAEGQAILALSLDQLGRRLGFRSGEE